MGFLWVGYALIKCPRRNYIITNDYVYLTVTRRRPILEECHRVFAEADSESKKCGDNASKTRDLVGITGKSLSEFRQENSLDALGALPQTRSAA
jgi:hypothetical protein